MIVDVSEDIRCFDGSRPSTSVTCPITWFPECSWPWRSIFATILSSRKRIVSLTRDRFTHAFRIHPRTKHDVAYRLSRSGLAIAYGQPVEYQGPIVKDVHYSSGSDAVKIVYTSVSSIELRNTLGFEVRR